MWPRRETHCHYSDHSYSYFRTYWVWLGHVFWIRCRVIPSSIDSSWSSLLKRRDLDARVIKQCIVRISVFPRYDNVPFEDIYKEIVRDLH